MPRGNSNLGELLTDIPTVSTDLTSISAITRNSVIAFYAICFSVLKACSYWNSDTLAAIVHLLNMDVLFITQSNAGQTVMNCRRS